jgi:hypothetical protein
MFPQKGGEEVRIVDRTVEMHLAAVGSPEEWSCSNRMNELFLIQRMIDFWARTWRMFGLAARAGSVNVQIAVHHGPTEDQAPILPGGALTLTGCRRGLRSRGRPRIA